MFEQDLGSLEDSQLNGVIQKELPGQTQPEGVKVCREINTTGVNLSFWHNCLHPAQARNKTISSVALEKKYPKRNQPKPNQPMQHTTKQTKNPPSN